MLGVTPMSDAQRTLALCVAVALTLGGIGAAGVVAMRLIAATGSVSADELQTAGELAQIPVILAGGGLIGVLAARWLRFPGAALAAFAVFVLIGLIPFGQLDGQSGAWWFWWYTSTPMDSVTAAEPLANQKPLGEPWWHTAYLVGLGVCATVAAVYRGRGPKLAAVGLPVVAVTVALGLLQLR
jgi:hypothetical protein